MANTRWGLLREIYSSWKAQLLTGVPLAAGVYQFLCDQFGLPTIPEAWNMTGALFPWWGWLLVAQVGALYGLFEYVRKLGFASLTGANSVPEYIVPEKAEVIRTFWTRTGGSSTRVPHHVVAGIVIVPPHRLTNVRVYVSHAIMAGHNPHPPQWGEWINRRLVTQFGIIQAGDQQQVKLFERDWGKIENPVVLAGANFGTPSELEWPFRKLRIEIFSDELTESRDLALFMPGYSVIMLVDETSVEMSGNTFAGPLSLNDPRIRNDQ